MRSLPVVLATLGMVALMPAAATAAPSTTLASAGPGGIVLPGGATDVTMTPDARYIAFVTAEALDPADGNLTRDVYRRDRRTGALTWISVAAGAFGNDGSSSHPSLSDDGNRVAFESLSDNLVPGDVNGGSDVYVRDVAAGTTVRASVRLDGGAAGPATTTNDDVMLPVLSGDGSTVAWVGPDFAFTGVMSTTFHVFARRLDQQGAERVDGTPVGQPGNGPVANAGPSISADGRLVAFASAANDLVPGDSNAQLDVFVRDRVLQLTARASVSSAGGQGTGGESTRPVISADGSAVAFDSFAPNLVAGDLNGATDVFVRDLRAGQTARVSVTGAGGESQYGGRSPAISADGRRIAFQTITPLVNTDPGTGNDVYLVDRQTGALARTSVTTAGGNGSADAGAPLAVGATGRYVLFESLGAFVANDNNGATDGYLRDDGSTTPPVAVPGVSVTPGSLDITVDGTGSRDADGWVESYSWSFGDGTTASGARGPHAYAEPGRYSVVLTVTDDSGITSTATTAVEVTVPPAPVAPGPPPVPAPPPAPPPPAPALKAPRNLERPSIRRDRRDARLLRCVVGRWEGRPAYAYRWLRNGKAIRNATRKTYRITRADAGRRLRCRVTASIPGRPAGTAASPVRRVPRKA